MKLLSFTPWQQCKTSLPASSSNDEDVVLHRIATRPSGNKSRDFQVDAIPTLSLTTSHQISVLGQSDALTTKKKTKEDSSKSSLVQEIPQWIYTSRPGESSSFVSKNTNKHSSASKGNAPIGTVIDSNGRKIYCLQNNNTILKVWDLDANVTGPDDDSEDNKNLKKVEFASPVVCMESIPIKRRLVKRSKHNEGCRGGYGADIQSGVVGLLSNGQVFVALMPSSSDMSAKVGIFGKDESSRSRRKSNGYHRNGVANGSSMNGNGSGSGSSDGQHLISIASISLSNEGSPTVETSRKRKISSIETNSDEKGVEIMLTTLSINSKSESVVLARHKLAIPSFYKNVKRGETEKVEASYSKESSNIELPNIETKGGGEDDRVRVTQLDLTHVAVVYRGLSDSWQCLVIDTRHRERATESFSLSLGGLSVVDIGGLSASILSVLSSDNMVRVYDIRRFVLLHEQNVLESFAEEGENAAEGYCNFRLATNWFTGTIGIISKHLETISFSFASVGIFNAANVSNEEKLSEVGQKPMLRGAYNLATIIASSIATANVSIATKSRPYTKEIDAINWYTGEKSPATFRSGANDQLESFLKGGGVKKNGKNGNKDDASLGFEKCSQELIDAAVSTAIDRIHSKSLDLDQKKDAVNILNGCIKSGKICGRDIFNNTKGDRSLYSLFTALSKSFGENSPTKKDILYRPLYLMHCLLHHCNNSVPEHMLVTMIHFVLCHTTDAEFAQHWKKVAGDNSWYDDASTTVLRKRKRMANSQLLETNGDKARNAELQNLVASLDRKLSTSRQLFFIRKIVTYSQCNASLLRAALRDGLLQSEKGEVETLLLSLSSLLRKVGRNKHSQKSGTVNRSTSITQWMSALTDAYLGKLLSSSGPAIGDAQKRVSEAISQATVVLGLKELMDFVDESLKERKKGSNRQESLAEPPLYGIEPLIF